MKLSTVLNVMYASSVTHAVLKSAMPKIKIHKVNTIKFLILSVDTIDYFVKGQVGMAKKKVQALVKIGASRIPRNEAYSVHVAVTKDDTQ